MKIDQVKALITDPEQTTNEYTMFKVSGNLYQVILSISNWIPGEYTYHIWAKDIAGNEQTSSEKTFTISEELLADANGPYTGETGEAIQFYGSAVGGSPPYSYEWDFGDGENSYEQDPTHVYTTADTYTVTLTVTDATDATDEDTTTAEITQKINNPPDKPTITGKENGKAGDPYTYIFASTDSDGDDVSYYIKWGDGDITDWTTFQPSGPPGYSESHIWSAQKKYNIEAKAKDTDDAESDWSTLEVSMPKIKRYTTIIQFFRNIRSPILYYILLKTLKL